MKTKGLVSVIVPVYNVADYVGSCIESLVKQTYENIEIIVINDGSTDNGLSVCRTWEEKDSRIMVIDQANQGVSVARNAGLAACTGEWICFVDGDDFLETDAIEQMIARADHDTDILITDYYVDTETRSFPESFFSIRDHDFAPEEHIELIKNCYLRTPMANASSVTLVGVPWAKLFRADVIKKNHIIYDKTLRKMQDALFLSETFHHSMRIRYRTVPTYHYRQNSVSVTHKGNARYRDIGDAVMRAFGKFIRRYHYEKELAPVWYARKFIFTCECVKFIYILDDTGMRITDKVRGIRDLMKSRSIDRHRRQAWPYLERPYRIAYLLHRMWAYGLMYLMMSAFYGMKRKRLG